MSTKKHRVVLVGCGSMAGGWLLQVKNFHADRVEMVGFVDISADAAKKRAEEFGAAKDAHIGTSLEEALKKTKPDVVFNCTIPEAHTATCKTALEAGCHVLVEKPLAPTVAEGKELIAAGKKAGKILAVIQNRRYTAGIIAVRQALKDGVIGPVHTILADFFLAPRFGGFRDAMMHPLLLDMSIHTFDQARFLSGKNPTSVFCYEFNPSGSWYAQGASAMAIFELTGGGVFNYRGSWCAQGLQTSWHANWRFIGERGTLLWNGETAAQAETIDTSPGEPGFFQKTIPTTLTLTPLEPSQSDHAGNIGEFLDAVDGGASPQTEASDNIQSLAMVEAAVNSAQTQKKVPV
jgi:predicted dehydrogenase